MRSFIETTARNLLRPPLLLGVTQPSILGLTASTLGVSFLVGSELTGNCISFGYGILGYGVLRLFSKYARTGWEESVLWQIEKRMPRKTAIGTLSLTPSVYSAHSPDTLEEQDLLNLKDSMLDGLSCSNQKNHRRVLVCASAGQGLSLSEASVDGDFDFRNLDWFKATAGIYSGTDKVYSLYRLPVSTDPLWFFHLLLKIQDPFKVIVSFQRLDSDQTKKRIEHSRRRTAHQDQTLLSDIDSEVTFEESSQVLSALSRGHENILKATLVIVSKAEIDLDRSLFCLERNPKLAIASSLGLRRRSHRSHWVRGVTATDLIPNVLDPLESGVPILHTLRKKPLYFSPTDSRLEALHWLVVGASGSGKSFFTGLVLKRMIENQTPMSVLFLDHNRSFRRVTRAFGSHYFEPQTLKDAKANICELFLDLDRPFALNGFELSDLPFEEKQETIRHLLTELENYLRARQTTHPIYIVFDECWAILREESLLVQRAFREFRKLNAGAIAVTQSLSDFLTDSTGQSIFQNTPIRILLRQGEDLTRFQGVLNLNSIELKKVRSLRQEKGVFSECLIKTPFLSKIGRLYPMETEHTLLRTDNIREELIAEAKSMRSRLARGEG